jgi:hypothetical protein
MKPRIISVDIDCVCGGRLSLSASETFMPEQQCPRCAAKWIVDITTLSLEILQVPPNLPEEGE